MVYEYQLYYLDGYDPTESTIYIFVSIVHYTMLYICMGRLDPWINRYDS